MSDLFDSLDAGDLDEIAGKLNVGPLNEEKCITDDEKKKLDKIPAQLGKSTKKHAKQAKDLRAVGIGEQINDLFSDFDVPDQMAPPASGGIQSLHIVEENNPRHNPPLS